MTWQDKSAVCLGPCYFARLVCWTCWWELRYDAGLNRISKSAVHVSIYLDVSYTGLKHLSSATQVLSPSTMHALRCYTEMWCHMCPRWATKTSCVLLPKPSCPTANCIGHRLNQAHICIIWQIAITAACNNQVVCIQGTAEYRFPWDMSVSS